MDQESVQQYQFDAKQSKPSKKQENLSRLKNGNQTKQKERGCIKRKEKTMKKARKKTKKNDLRKTLEKPTLRERHSQPEERKKLL